MRAGTSAERSAGGARRVGGIDPRHVDAEVMRSSKGPDSLP